MKRKSVLLLSTLVTAALLLVALLVAFSLTAGLTLAAPLDAPLTMPLHVFGTITSDTVWTEAGSPYVVTDTLTVSEGVTLTIQPGVVVKFDDDKSLIVHGKLYAVGTPAKPILFTSNGAPAANTWGEIRLEQWVYPSILRYCQVEYATQGLVLIDTVDGNQILNNVFRYNGGAIRSFHTWGAFFVNNVLAYNGYGFLFEGSGLLTTLAGNAIHDNTQWGIKTDSSYTAWDSNFSSNAIHDNGGPGILFEAGGVNLPTVRGNALYGNGSYQLENQSAASLTADGNWWGTNAPSAGTTFSGTIAYSPPIQLSASGNPVSIPADGSSTSVISALMTDGSGHYPPGGTYVSFTTTMGSVDSRLTEVESGAVGKEGQFLTPHAEPGASGGDLRWSNNPGETITYTFTGDSIVYVYAVGNNCGYANVFVDGTAYPSIDMYSLTFTPQVERVVATDLGPGTHTITVSVAGINNPHSSNFYVYSDAFKVGSGDGLVTTTLTSGIIPGTATVTATAPGPASVATTVDFGLTLGPPTTVTLEASPATLPVNDTSRLTATVLDQYANPLPGQVITFSTSSDLDGGGISPVTATTNGSGQAVSYISSTITGIKLVVATAPNLVAGTTTVTFTAPSGCEDDYEPDNSVEYATTVTPPSTTHHNFDTANDLDWVRFWGIAGITYTIETVNLAVSGDQQVDTKIFLYYESDAVELAYDDDGGEPLYGSKIVWPVTTTGWYYVNVGQVIGSWSFAGCDTYYDLRISGPPTGVYLPIILKNYPPAPTPVCCPVWEATVGVEDAPRGIAINTATNRIYVANHDDDTISIIDGGTNVLTGTIDLSAYGSGPSGIAYHPSGLLYVSLGHSDKVAIINASTGAVETTVDVGVEPAGVAVNPVTGRVYVANFGCDSVSVISGSTVVRVIPVEDRPSQIAVNPVTNLIFVTNKGQGDNYGEGSSVSVIDGNSDTVIKTIRLVLDVSEPGQAPFGIAVNPNTNKIYVAVIDSRHLVVIDGNNLDARPTYIAPPLNLMLWMVAVNPDLNRVYAVGYNEYGTNKLFVLDGATNAWLPCDLDVGSYPEYGIAFNSETGRLYVSNRGSDDVTVIWTCSAAGPPPCPSPPPSPSPTPPPPLPPSGCYPTVEATLTVGNDPHGVAFGNGMIYVANYGDGTVSVINGTTYDEVTTIDDVDGANGVAYDGTHNLVYVTMHDSAQLAVIDASTNTVSETVSVGYKPNGVAYNPTANKIYVANYGDHAVTILDGDTRAVIATLTVASETEPAHIAVNPVTNKVYVAYHGSGRVGVIDGKTDAISIVDIYSAGPYGITVDTVRNLVYVATIDTHRIVAIDGASDTYLGWAEFHKGQDPEQPAPMRVIAINPNLGDTGHLYATTALDDGGFDRLFAIRKGWEEYFNRPYAMDVGTNPREGIAVNLSNNQVYVTAGPNRLTILKDGEPPCMWNFAMDFTFTLCRVGIEGDCR